MVTVESTVTRIAFYLKQASHFPFVWDFLGSVQDGPCQLVLTPEFLDELLLCERLVFKAQGSREEGY